MNIDFKYEIGQEVTLRGMLSPFWAAEKSVEIQRALGVKDDVTPRPQKMIVASRIAEECPGGVQLHYKVRVYALTERGWRAGSDTNVARELFTFLEFELVPWADAMLAEREKPHDPA